MNQVPADQRRAHVADVLRSTGAITVTDLRARFGVSSMTARRDLAILAERGVARRTHGGAVLPAVSEPAFLVDHDPAPGAARIHPGETIFLDASEVAGVVAAEIVYHELHVRVITNSLAVVHALAAVESVQVFATGGDLGPNGAFTGPRAVEAIRAHFADRAFVSGDGEIARAMRAQASERVRLPG